MLLCQGMAECLPRHCHGRMSPICGTIMPWQDIFKLKHRTESAILKIIYKEVEIL